MQGLVVGGGSIGKRHLQNLKLLGIDCLALVETDPERRAAVASELKIRSFADLTAGLNWPPDFVVVATPTHLHAEQTLSIVEKGLPVFVEKPLLFARLQAGSYLPSWRPSQDYRANYAAREETGGGCVLDCIHEIDLAGWYLGEVQKVFCVCGKLSSLEIATEDVAALVCRHESGALSEIHLDYVQRTYERDCQIVGEQGSIFWEFKHQQVRWFDAAGGQWTTFAQPPGWELNQMYVDEMKHFLECVRDRRPTVLPIPDAISVMQIAFAAKASAREGRLITIKKEAVA